MYNFDAAMNKVVAPAEQEVETQTAPRPRVERLVERRVEGRGIPFDGFFSIANSGAAASTKAGKVFRSSSSVS